MRSSELRSLDAKVALISGSGRGIGRALALKLAREGACVVVNDRDREEAQAVVATIERFDGVATACAGDVTDPDFGSRFIECALNRFGGLDIIVNNAGYAWDAVIQRTSDEQFDRMLDVHLRAAFRILRAAARPIQTLARADAAQGREVFRKVVNVTSLAARGNAGQIAYASAKAGLEGLTRTLSKEWGRYKVNVNCVAFGLIDTRLLVPAGSAAATLTVDGRSVSIGINPQLLEHARTQVPLGRLGTPEEAANAIFLLCTPESDYISGHTLVCAGGLTI
jgi:3-oxoacyl-[acyl-carrier protein] reductase